MSLFLVPTPIGHAGDWTSRAIETLKGADLIIVEEFREGTTLLKQIQIAGKPLEQLNEHSKEVDVEALSELCRSQMVALISDCGTPNFCDPGAALVRRCRDKNISIRSLPGPSSLMTLLSLSSERLNEFVFVGFLPAEKSNRLAKLKQLQKESRPMVLMDTPYRLNKLIEELTEQMPRRKALLATDISQDSEQTYEGSLEEIKSKIGQSKAEFLILIYGRK